MQPKRLLMIVGDFVEDYEAMVPFQALQMAGPYQRARSVAVPPFLANQRRGAVASFRGVAADRRSATS